MKLSFVFLTLFFALTYSSSGQNKPSNLRPERINFVGHILDASTGRPLAGASVVLPDLRKGTVSDTAGIFKIPGINAGKYLVEISFTGYKSIIEPTDINNNGPKTFALAPSYLEAEAVTVTGVSAATSVKRTPVPVNIVKKEDLLRGSSTNLVDALSHIPGVSQIATGPAISKPVIRGLGYNRVVVVNDGIRQEGQQWGDEHGIEIDELNVSRAEVLKGPASLMYGSDALAGVVNFISIVPATPGTIKGNVLANYQTNNRQRALHADIGGNHNGFIWGGHGSYKAAGDYKNRYDGHVFNSRFNEKDFGGYIGLNKSWGFTHLYFSSFDQRVGLVEGTRDSASGKFTHEVFTNGQVAEAIADRNDKSNQPDLPSQRVRHFKIAADNSFRLGGGRLTLTLGYQRNHRQEYGDILAPNEAGLDFNLGTINYNLQYHLRSVNNWNTTFGINGMDQENVNEGTEALIPEYTLFDIGGFGYTQKRLGQLTISAGVRMDNRHINARGLMEGAEEKFRDFSKNYSNLSASVGFTYEATNEVTVKLNLARGFRAPAIPELASNGAHEGTNRFEFGNQDLASEKSWQVDAGADFASEHVSLSANLFVNSIRDFIFYRKLSAASGSDSIISREGNDYYAFRFNQSDAVLYGAEANFDIHPHPLDWLHIENSFSYVRGKLTHAQDGSNNLPFVPAARLINEVKGDFLKNGKRLKNLYLKTELENTFRQNNPFLAYNTETATAGYSLWNAGFGADVVSKSRTLFSIFFSANNITDKAYQNHLSRLKYTDINQVTGRQGVYNMGRNFSVKVNVPLSFTSK